MPELQASEQNEIERLTKAFGDDWTAHDAHALFADFAEDGFFINFMGQLLEGREATETSHQPLFESLMAESRMTISDIRVKSLGSDAALSSSQWTLTGQKTPQGKPDDARNGRLTLVFVRVPGNETGGWQIVSAQNTQITQPPGGAPPGK